VIPLIIIWYRILESTYKITFLSLALIDLLLVVLKARNETSPIKTRKNHNWIF